MTEADVRESLAVRRTSGLHAGWKLGEILRHGHRTGGVDGISYLDYLSRRGEANEQEAARTILAHLSKIPSVDPGTYAAELDRLIANSQT